MNARAAPGVLVTPSLELTRRIGSRTNLSPANNASWLLAVRSCTTEQNFGDWPSFG